jgi:SAM-dependent methyltransferase
MSWTIFLVLLSCLLVGVVVLFVFIRSHTPHNAASNDNKEVVPEKQDEPVKPVHRLLPLIKSHVTDSIQDFREYIKTNLESHDQDSETEKLNLELGPGGKPLLDITSENTRFLDAKTTEELKASVFNDTGVSVPVHYVWSPGNTYRELVGDGTSFDNVVSSHNFEHLPNPVGHLQEVGEILKPGGRYYMVVPHHDGTFDYYRPYSTIGDLLEAYLQNRGTHRLSSLLNHALTRTHNLIDEHMSGNHGLDLRCFDTPEKTMEILEKYEAADLKGEYYDTHGWIWDEYSLAFALERVIHIGLIPMELETVTKRRGHEFLVVLKKHE